MSRLHPSAFGYLRGDVHLATVDEDVAILDIREDGYFCLTDCASGLDDPSGQRRVEGELAVKLQERGWLSHEPSRPARLLPPVPRRSLRHDPHISLRLSDWGALAAASRDLRRAEKAEGLAPLLALAGEAPVLRDDSDRVRRAASALWRVQPWLPFDGECLQRSALLAAFLRRLGLKADWVFGVRLWPFNAHCWVQADDECLNDDYERLQAYTPIYCR